LDGIVEQALSRVGLSPAVANRFPHQLSGGMKQRAAMAIATVLRPKVIIADEPTSALDVVVQRQVMLTLKRVQSDLGAAMLLIGHDIGLIAQFSDTIGVLYAGKLVERGPIAAVLDAPAHPYTRLLIDSLPGLDSRKEFIGIPGLPPALFDRPTGCHFHPRCPFAFDRCRTETPVLQTLNGQRPEPVEGQRRESIEGQRPEPVEGQRPEPVEGWQVACHLYPSHVQLPPLPAKSVFVGGDRATLSPESATLPPESAPARAGQSSSEGDLSTAGATPGRREPEEAQP
jgi:peptide/nickel transport system ATP-binding protein